MDIIHAWNYFVMVHGHITSYENQGVEFLHLWTAHVYTDVVRHKQHYIMLYLYIFTLFNTDTIAVFFEQCCF